MNLHSPIFDPVRIPARVTPDMVASAICENHGMPPDDIRHTTRWSGEKLVIRNEIVAAFMAHQFGVSNVANWFRRHRRTVNDWLLDAGVTEPRPRNPKRDDA